MTAAWPDLLALPDVRAAAEQAETTVAAIYRHPANLRGWPRTAAAASVRAARASALLDGGPGRMDDEVAVVQDPVLAGALRVAAELAALVPVWRRAPLQALARLHTLAAADLVTEGELGRPREDAGPRARLVRVGRLVLDPPWPSAVTVAVVHAELLAVSPFVGANGVLARAAARLTAMTAGLDPRGLGVPEAGFLAAGPGYDAALEAYRIGAPDGVREWVLLCCRAQLQGAREARSVADTLA
ncbi:oxidoreductase [Nakamurella flavida]|uniref:Oxidoreductase n=1 Tax=Nakamurella flavida TaxID=363630 RepID=A0A939C019_9ACTN|nr:oxidoreductase [Nakamurella flavida]MBM9476263.1 oxidoreductase [Nakamurella flavida]MDP9779639.1 hypothetical protein [Nakamurella flavida]